MTLFNGKDEASFERERNAPPIQRNPFAIAILAIWLISGLLGILLMGIGGSKYDALESLTYGIYGTSLLSLAVIGALIHLAVKAVRWNASQ